jgi:hypothetical protein
MTAHVETPTRTFVAGAALAADRRVKLTSGKLAYAGINDVELGTIEIDVFADLDRAAVRLRSAEGTGRFVAAAAISVGADVYAAADGKVNDVGGAEYIGVALTASSGDGCVIEVLRQPAPAGSLTHLTGTSSTLTRSQRNSTFTNLGLGAAHTVTLPQDALAGDKFHFCVMAAQELRIDPGAAGAIYINGGKQTDDAYISADDEAEHVTLTADGNGDWVAGPYNGTWTVV